MQTKETPKDYVLYGFLVLSFSRPRTYYGHNLRSQNQFSVLGSINHFLIVELPPTPAKIAVELSTFQKSWCLCSAKVDLLQTIFNWRQARGSTRNAAPQECLKVSHSELKTIFHTGDAEDGYFPRAAHKSLLFHNVSESELWHVLREVWVRLPTHVLEDSRWDLLWSQSPGFSKKKWHFSLKGHSPRSVPGTIPDWANCCPSRCTL